MQSTTGRLVHPDWFIMKIGFTRLLVLFLLFSTAVSAGELSVLSEDQRASANYYQHLQSDAYELLATRKEGLSKLIDKEAIESYQRLLRTQFIEALGGFPEKTPLNPHIIKRTELKEYTIENVIFESQPNHHVTGNMYVPRGDGPFPVVVVSSGHSRTAKLADYNQRFGIRMATLGIASFVFDPIGQGERSQVVTPEVEPLFNGTTTEHFLIGTSSILVGRNTATYRIWDAMRAIDYVHTRDDIDTSKIGYTGCSGGGTLTSYIMALDPRVTCAAPACYLTTFRKLIETRGPQDSEQNIFGQIAFGMDHPDYVIMRAPRPTLITSTTGDYFDIKGAWENYRQAKRVYGVLGYPHQVDMVEVEGSHGVKPQSLATIGHWMQRWLLEKDANVAIRDFEDDLQESTVLNCTESGQVLSLKNERSVFDLNAELAKSLAAQRQETNGTLSDEALRTAIRKLAGIRNPSELPAPKMEEVGRIFKDGYHIDKLVLHTDSGIPLPGLTFHPKKPQDGAYVYLTDTGKTGDSEKNGPIEKLMNDNYAVVTIDLRGQGETGRGERDEILGDWKQFYLAYLMGKSLVGPRTEDALATGHFVANYDKPAGERREVHLVGVGQAGIVALHAAAMNPDLFTSVTIKDVPKSWTEIVGSQDLQGQLDSIVHGALRVYDLPDLVRLAGPEKVKFETSAE